MAAEQIGRKLKYDIDGGLIQATVRYRCTSISDLDTQLQADWGATPTFGGLNLSTSELDEDSEVVGSYIAEVVFAKYPERVPQEVGDDARTSLNMSLRPTTIKLANSVTAYAPSGETAPDHGKLIDVRESSNGRTEARGADWFVPEVQFSKTGVIAKSAFTDAYIATLKGMMGQRNNATFAGFAAKRVLLAGVVAHQRGQDDVEITYTFWVDDNETGLTITNPNSSNITSVTRDAWDILIASERNVTDSTANDTAAETKAVYVYNVTDDVDFSTLLGI